MRVAVNAEVIVCPLVTSLEACTIIVNLSTPIVSLFSRILMYFSCAEIGISYETYLQAREP